MDIQNPRLLYAKAGAFLLVGALAALLLILEHPTLKTALLLLLAVWAMCRAYYFAFYVIHHYIDPTFRYRGLLSLVRHLILHGKNRSVSPSFPGTYRSRSSFDS